MQRTTKPETSHSMSSVPYHQSQSLVSLPMLPRPSTAASLALAGAQFDGQKRARVNSKAGTLGSLFRTKMHSKRSSTAGSDSMLPILEPQDAGDAAWGVGIDYPATVSPLFSDESLQQLMGSSPQLTSHGARRPSSPTLAGAPELAEAALAAGSANGPMSPASARRSKREIAASVLHNSAGPFRRLRSGPASKTMSFPPAVSDNSLYRAVASDEFVVVTPDMCPPASLVSSSVISGVSPLEASAAAAAASSSALPALGADSDAGRGAGTRGVTPRHHHPRSRTNVELRTRALTQVSKSSEHLLLLRDGAYEDSTDSLVRISTPSLSTSSSEASLPLSQAPGLGMPPRKKAPAPLLTQPRPQHGLQLPQGSALGPSFKPPLPRNACVLAPAPTGRAGSPRRASECSFSSNEERVRLSPFVQLDALSPYTVSRLNTTAARASERRRRPSERRPRTSSTSSSVHWALSATSDATLLADSSRSRHARNLSDVSDYDSRRDASFDFQIQSAESETFWPDESPPESDGDELEQQIAASGFPSSCSANFNFEVGRDVDSSGGSPRQRSQSSGAVAAHSPTRAGAHGHAFPHAISSLLDPSSPASDGAERSMALNMLAHPRRMRAYTSAVPDASREYDDDLDLSLSPTIPDHFDFDGSTLTQPNDWQLMSASSSDGEQLPQLHSHPRRRVRKRRVLPKTMFNVSSKHSSVADAALYGDSQSSDTLHPGPDDSGAVVLELPRETSAGPGTKHDESRGAFSLAVSAGAVATATHAQTGDSETVAAAAVIAATPEMQMLLNLELIPRLPRSMQHDLDIAHVARLTLVCAGDAGSWQPARIACFALRLAAAVGRARGLRELTLLNLGLTAIPRSVLRCPGLQRLNMAHNWIGAVPGWLARLPRLEHIVLAGNPLRVVSADLVEMRQRLATLDFGCARKWALLSRRPPPPPPPPLSADERAQVLVRRLQATAARRMAAAVGATCLSVTRRQHEAALDRATRLLALYSNTLYSTLREPRSWGHSVALPLPPVHHSLL